MDTSTEWPLPESKVTYTVQFDHAPWIEGGIGHYDGLTLEQAKEEIEGMRKRYPQVQARYVKATTTYEYVVVV